MAQKLTDVGHRIRLAREEAGLTQAELAEKLQLSAESRQTIAKWEKGEAWPHYDYLMAMCEVFNCDLGHLLCQYECRTQSMNDICEITGLTENAISALQFIKDSPMRDVLFTLSKMIEKTDIVNFLRAIHVHVWDFNNNRLQTDNIDLVEVAKYMNCKPHEVKNYLENSSTLFIQSMLTKIISQLR